MEFRGRTALVTGAGIGTGACIARALARGGAAVAVNDIVPERAQAVADEIGAGGGTAVPIAFDITSYAAVEAGVREIEAALAPVDILVNNVGMPQRPGWDVPFLESAPDEWPTFIDINMYGSMNCLHLTVPGMCERGWGRAIQLSSGAAARGLPPPAGHGLLGASKAGIEGLLRHLALEVAQRGVTVNTVALGQFANAVDHADPEVIELVRSRIPLGRAGTFDEAASAVIWLASEDAGFVTGQVVHINGGSYQGR